jgi:signal transduction histidine kinase
MSLRLRLVASYLVLLAVTLGIITAALLLLISNQKEPPYNTYQELAAFSRATYQELGSILRPRVLPRRQTDNQLIQEQLTTFAESNELRIMVVNLLESRVRFDTAGVYPIEGTTLEIELDTTYNPGRFRNWLPERNDTVAGSFQDNTGQEWLFIGVEAEWAQMGEAIIIADERPDRNLQSALAQFGSALGMPILQSAVVGFVVALGLSAVISSTIARPLRNFAKAAEAVAQGDYDHAVPVEGPSEIRAVAEAFNLMTHEVQNTHQSQRDFLANVSHDLKTPLTSIQGYSQAIMDGAAKDPARAAAIICDEAGRLTRMVTELTDLARLQAGAIHMQMSAIDAGQIVQSIAQRLGVVAQKKGITLQSDIQTTAPIAGDGDRLAQVFTNLISNAINYTPEGGSIWVTAKPGRGGVEISVRDTGVGIPVDELERIFERFYQVDKTRGPRRGTGLGLAITREIVQAHGGHVSVSSPGRGNGSTFTVWLPVGQLAVPTVSETHRGTAIPA